MFLGKVIGDCESEANPGARNSGLKLIQKLDLYRNPSGPSTIAVNYVGAGDGDIVIVRPQSTTAAAPGATGLESSDAMIMGILDRSSESRPASRLR